MAPLVRATSGGVDDFDDTGAGVDAVAILFAVVPMGLGSDDVFQACTQFGEWRHVVD